MIDMKHISDCVVGDVFYDNLKKREVTVTDRAHSRISFDNGDWLSYGDFPVSKERYSCVKAFSPKFKVGDVVDGGFNKKGFVVQTGAKVDVQWMGDDYVVHHYPEHLLNLVFRS